MNFQLLVFKKLDQTDLEISKNLHREHSANKTHPSSRGQKMKHKRNENCHFYSFQNNQKVSSLRENDASKFIKERFIKGHKRGFIIQKVTKYRYRDRECDTNFFDTSGHKTITSGLMNWTRNKAEAQRIESGIEVKGKYLKTISFGRFFIPLGHHFTNHGDHVIILVV